MVIYKLKNISMKTLILLFLSICFIIPLDTFGQASIPPANVTKAFNQKFPSAHTIKWYNEGKDFKTVFKAEGYSYEATYNNNGDWLMTQRTISMKELPTAVKTGLTNSKFSTWKLNAVYVLFLPGMITQYRLIVSSGGDTKNLLFSWDGKLLNDDL